jgi:L-aminopeptidase/D-esterase-like protein
LFLAFSTANQKVANVDQINIQGAIPNDLMDPIFAAVDQTREEAVVDALIDDQIMAATIIGLKRYGTSV